MMQQPSDIFIPNDAEGDRKSTAILLVGTASEFGVSQQSIRSTYNGFYITQELADLIYEDEADAEPEATTTSGNRAAKNASKEGK